MAGKENGSPNFDKGLIQAAIGKKREIQLVKGIKLELKGGDKIDSRILVITGFRFFIVIANKAPYKVDLSVNLLDIHAIESKKPEQIVVQYGEKQVKFSLIQPGIVHFVIGQLISNLKTNFPGGNLDVSIKKDVEPSEKLQSVNNVVNKLTSSESLTETGPCGGFSHSYACICDHMGVPFLEEVAWDVDTIYLSNDTKEFKIQDFDHLEPRELIPVIATLEYNVWFTKIVCDSYKLSAEILDVIARVLKRSTTIVEVVLDGVSLGREFCQKLETALTSNPKCALERIDLSRNPSAEDRGIVHLVGGFSKLSHGLDSLNLHDTGITTKGATAIGHMIKISKYMSTSLTSLNLSNNPIKADGVTAICGFLAQANALTHIDLSSTDCFVESIFGALIRGCCQNLTHLNMSGNQFTNRKSKDTNLSSSFQQFFSSTAALKEVKMSECRLPADAVRAILLGLIDNNVVKEITLDISKNELKAAGLRAMTGPLGQIGNLYSLDLSDNGFETDTIALCESLCENKTLKKLYIGQNFHKSRSLNNIMEALIKLISVETSPIEFLSLAESRLKQSVTLLFDSLGTNESLVELDISGNQMGDEGARVLAKALQINSKLRTIHWDRNSVTQNGLRDIALALENNLTLQTMPIPIYDVSMCLKPSVERALKQIEKCLSRNHSPNKAITEQAYRLQQGLMMTSTQQQMVDKLIVQLQDTSRILRSSSDESVASALRNALRCINDADKLKQLLLKFHMSVSSKNVEERLSFLAYEVFNSIQEQMKKNVQKILECAESNCPFVTEQQGVKESLKTACEGKANVNKAFIDTVLLQQLAPIILNKVSETNLNLSTIVVDTLMDEVITQLEKQQAKLDILVKEHGQQAKPVEEKPTEIEEHNDNLSEAAQKAKNRLSAVNNRRSVRFPDDENDVFAPASHGPRRRPTISRKRKSSEVSEDHSDRGAREESKKKEPVVPNTDTKPSNLSRISRKDHVPAMGDTKQLVHVTKNRPRPARGRRPPTRASGGQQNSVVGPEIVVDNFDDGIDSFFSKPAVRPQSAALPDTMKLDRGPLLPKSATISQHKKKHEKEEAEDNQKEPQEKKKLGILGGLFKKKNQDKKSPSGSRKESRKDHNKKSREDLTGAGTQPEKKPESKPVEPVSKPVEVSSKPVEEVPNKAEKHEKPVKQPKRPPMRPLKPAEKPAPSEAEKLEKPVSAELETKPEVKLETKPEVKLETKPEVKLETKPEVTLETKPEVKPETSESDEALKEKDVVEEEKKKGDDGKQEAGEEEPAEAAKEENVPVTEELQEKPKPQPKAPPKFGVGLPMGPMGGDLLAEMKKRSERSSSAGKKPSPEPKQRARVATNPDPQRPMVPARPSSVKGSMRAKSAANLNSVAQDGKPSPQPRNNEGEGERRRLSNEASKPVHPKPAPREKPQPGQKPTIPKRPPSVSRNSGNSQKLETEKRKSAEAETVPETKTEEEKPEKPVVKNEGDETKDSKETKDISEGQVSDEPSEKPQQAPEKDTNDEARKEEDIEKREAVEKALEDQKPEREIPETLPEKDTSISPEKDIAPEESTEAASEDNEAPEASGTDTTPSSEGEGDAKNETGSPKTSPEGDETTSSNETPERPKDSNDNETDVTETAETSTMKADTATTKADSDDVIKSSVDQDLLEEALTSAKDT